MANIPLVTSNNANKQNPKTIEQTYQKKTQLEHILLRPDTYIGSVEKHTANLWVYDETNQMVHKSITYVPGLYKIFDEILVNAADNKQRDPKMDSVQVVIDPDANLISVYNNGDGVPVEIHKEEGVYVPEMIFGHLLTSSNYDDEQKKTTGGRNGYGAKLANIFSTEFVIETADGKRLKKYKQVFSGNMGRKSEPIITKCKAKENWTKVSFKPDLAKFKMDRLEDDVVSLMKKRVLDIAGCLGKTVKVELNGQRVPVNMFSAYVDLYLKPANDENAILRFTERVNERWEICVCLSEGQFQQVSFVNGIATIKGGTHVDYITNQITNHILSVVNKKNKNANVRPHIVKNHLWVFVNALIDNPAFDSQTKETLTTKQSSFGSKCELSQEFLKKVVNKSGVVGQLLSWAESKLNKDLKKTDGSKKDEKIVGVDKLVDANKASSKESQYCTLILTEGDSAKTLAMSGMSVVGRDYYGVFPLRGKLLNVREATHKQIMDNAEIENLKKILGLKQEREYRNVNELRYGHLMIMTDQDHDGSHIKGLLINFIHTFWPSLLKIPSFMIEFITPIVKATNKGKVLSFYTMPEYESWRESLEGSASSWKIKYYKGLGTSTKEEAREYFSDLDKHRKEFKWEDQEDGDAIELAFSKKKIEARKNWLRQFEPGTFLDQSKKEIKYSDFINKELILFSIADLQRSIPSMVDGLKPGQRKILFCAFKKNLTKEIKVAQFAPSVALLSAYHHGEQSLATTIVGMAQDFVGSNNINLFLPNGQFGTRHQGGKDHASARYIFTELSPITRYLFHRDDDVLLDYLNEEGLSIEPTWYMPVIPMVLVNGSEGIGTGWSSYAPNYNPRDLVANVRRLLNGEPMQPMDPWYRGFKGTIEKTATKEAGVSYTVSGIIEEINETTLRITELPIRRWTQDYKGFLESLYTGNDKIKDPFIKDFKDYSDDTNVHFDVILPEENLIMAKQEGLLKKFKLTTTISTSNMHLFDSKGIIKKYDSPEQILGEFYHLRLEFYEKRKKVVLENLELELLKLDNKVRFILAVVEGKIKVSNRKKADLYLELREKGFTPFPKKAKPNVVVAGELDDDAEETEENSSGGRGTDDYDYLLQMAIGTLTRERVEKLCQDRDKLNGDVDEMRKETAKSLWMKDLDAIDRELDEQDKSAAQAEEKRLATISSRVSNEAGLKVARKAPRKPRKDSKNASKADAVAEPMETSDKYPDVTKPKTKAGPKKAPAKKGKAPLGLRDEEDNEEEVLPLTARLAAQQLGSSPDISEAMEVEVPKKSSRKAPAKEKTSKEDSDDEDEDVEISDVLDLKDRLAAHNLGSSSDHSESMEVEVPRKPTRKAAAKKKPLVISDDEDEEVEYISDDEDFEAELVKAIDKGGKKPAVAAAAKPPAGAAKKRGPTTNKQFGQKLITDVLKPVENAGISPEKKVRKMRESPFNKKSGSILNKESISPMSEDSGAGGSSEGMARITRPQRANRTKVTYISSSESEGEEDEGDDATDDSEFNEDED